MFCSSCSSVLHAGGVPENFSCSFFAFRVFIFNFTSPGSLVLRSPGYPVRAVDLFRVFLTKNLYFFTKKMKQVYGELDIDSRKRGNHNIIGTSTSNYQYVSTIYIFFLLGYIPNLGPLFFMRTCVRA